MFYQRLLHLNRNCLSSVYHLQASPALSWKLIGTVGSLPTVTLRHGSNCACHHHHHRHNYQHQQRRSYHAIKGVFGNYHPNPVQAQATSDDRSLSFSHRLVQDAFQKRGHQLAQLNLLETYSALPEVLTDGTVKQFSSVLGVDLARFIEDGSECASQKREFVLRLIQTYCGGLGYEFAHLTSLEEVQWLEAEIERLQAEPCLEDAEAVARSLLEAEAFDHFVGKKFQSVKRYSGEGAETMITFVEELIAQSEAGGDISEVIIGMPHRGRLNLLANTLKVPAEVLFRKMTGKNEYALGVDSPAKGAFIGDVMSHVYTSLDRPNLSVTLLPNPSHLEVVGTVVCGYARGKLMHSKEGPYDPTEGATATKYSRLPLQIHGDAAISGQGIVMETLAMANVNHWTVGGSIHLIVNNQVGYTNPGRSGQARSSDNCSDLMKMIHAPVIHVNGNQPEAVIRAARLAHRYRTQFHKDICVNLICYRKWGHNELDDPTFTNPGLYKKITVQKSIPQQFVQQIGLSEERKNEILKSYNETLNKAVASTEAFKPKPFSQIYEQTEWKDIQWPSGDVISKWRTSVRADVLKAIGRLSVQVPEDFSLHQTLKRVFADRLTKIEQTNSAGMDWATAESLAFGSLLWEGYNLRISGQDVGRGTFSQRHAMLVDQETDDVYIPLNSMNSSTVLPNSDGEPFGKFEVCNSILSEEGVMAFEYGLSLSSPNVLPIWEAQFGDFFNEAQPIIDTLICSGEQKWLLQSALTLLLPHGYDGAGPEHTSARLERFLQQSDSSEVEIDSDQVNWTVAYPTTPAQYFHLLRRQMIRPYRKPLIVMSPKMLLRHPRCVSTLPELSNPDSHFAPVLDDPKYYGSTGQVVPLSIGSQKVDSVKTVVFCSGKHYYTLEKEHEDRVASGKLASGSSIAFVRLEELCPFPAESLIQVLKRYPNAKKLVWSQEEHRNMGAWTFVRPRFENILGQKLTYAGRGHLAAPAVGIGSLHQAETKQILEDTFNLAK